MSAALLLCLQATTGAFVVRLGVDTLSVQRYTMRDAQVEGYIVSRGQVRYFSLALTKEGSLDSLVMMDQTKSSATHSTWKATSGGDTTIVVGRRGDSTWTLRVATPGGVLPYFGWSGLLLERYITWARSHGRTRIQLLSPGAAKPFVMEVTQVGKDSVTIGEPGEVPIRVALDHAGRIRVADGSATTEKYVLKRADKLDFDALMEEFASRPALGPLSPPDSIMAAIGGASVRIDYSRPSLRGRTAVGGVLVPYNQVWRTGANAATRLTTSADLMVAGQRIPAGTYTLFTLPAATGWKLIVSKQTKAPCQTAAQCVDPGRRPLWGTDYSPDSDLVRVDMQVEAVPASIEEFTITLQPKGDALKLGMSWEKTLASVEIRKP